MSTTDPTRRFLLETGALTLTATQIRMLAFAIRKSVTPPNPLLQRELLALEDRISDLELQLIRHRCAAEELFTARVRDPERDDASPPTALH